MNCYSNMSIAVCLTSAAFTTKEFSQRTADFDFSFSLERFYVRTGLDNRCLSPSQFEANNIFI